MMLELILHKLRQNILEELEQDEHVKKLKRIGDRYEYATARQQIQCLLCIIPPTMIT